MFIREARLAIVWLILLLFMSLPLGADVRGAVMTTEGKPIEKARVSLLAFETPDERDVRLLSEQPHRVPLVTGETDARGEFRLAPPKGTELVEVVIEARGYEPRRLQLLADDDAAGVPLRAAAEKEGRITTSGGKPVAGARVHWMGADGAELLSVTDEQGRYRVPDPGRWSRESQILHPDFAPESKLTVEGAAAMDRQLREGVTIRGRVLREDGKTPVEGAVLRVDGWFLGRSSADGSFEVLHAPADWKNLNATAPGLVGSIERGKGERVTLRPSSRISGTLVDGRNGDPIAHARLELLSGFRNLDVAIANGRGEFVFDSLVPGSYRLVLEHPRYALEETRVQVTPGEQTARRLRASVTSSIAGHVRGEDDKPVAAARIEIEPLESSDGFLMRVNATSGSFSAPDGRFLIRRTPSGAEFRLRASRAGLAPGNAGPFRLDKGETRERVLLTLPTGIRVTGVVRDRDGEAVGGARVAASEERDSGEMRMIRRSVGRREAERSSFVETDAAGTFTLQLAAGSYSFRFEHDHYAESRMNAVKVEPGMDPLEVVVDEGVEISGRIVRSDGSGIADVMINLIGESRSPEILSGADGSFLLSNLAPGPFMLIAVKPDDFIRETRSVKAPTSDLLIEIPPTGAISGRVVDKSSGAPVTDFQAGPSGERQSPGLSMMIGGLTRPFHDDQGKFVLENVPAGDTTLVVQAPGYIQKTIPGIEVREGETTEGV
ncbi:MAG TPA: carboxypeptidase regulatory-like domain-containing protein, partial [Thermoanaerobaculia bacterium]|nr:carboxypeptidase regulatory-like domain-containing protein [Thermoanaerobaculia bacterium]